MSCGPPALSTSLRRGGSRCTSSAIFLPVYLRVMTRARRNKSQRKSNRTRKAARRRAASNNTGRPSPARGDRVSFSREFRESRWATLALLPLTGLKNGERGRLVNPALKRWATIGGPSGAPRPDSQSLARRGKRKAAFGIASEGRSRITESFRSDSSTSSPVSAALVEATGEFTVSPVPTA